MSGNPTVSITTATYNCAATLPRAIESVLCQTYPDIDYVIMDGLSTDGTYEIAKSYEVKFLERGMRLRVFSERDRGMYDAINKAMDLADGEILGNVNGDDYYESDAVEKVVCHYGQEPFDVLYGSVRIHVKDGSFVKKAKPMLWANTRHWNHPSMFLAGDCARDYRYRLDNLHADLDLFLRIRKDGGKIAVMDDVLSNFVFGGMSNERDLAKMLERIKMRNRVYRDNQCGPVSYVETVLIEFAKYLKG